MPNKRCCVIGGAGYIGQHLVNVLISSGRRITVVDINPNSYNMFPKSVNCIVGDCSNTVLIKKILEDIDEIIYLTYTTNPKTSFDDPLDDFVKNISLGIKVIQSACELEIKTFLLVSTGGAIYGPVRQTPINEQVTPNPISPYGISKLALEKYALMVNYQKKLNVIIARPGNAFGEYQQPYKNLGFIINAIASIIDHKNVTLFGNKGTIRDYIYVKDIADALIVLLDKGKSGEIYNIGTQIGRTNKQVLKSIFHLATAFGYKPHIQYLPPRQFDVPTNILDINKITKQTNWTPQTPFLNGLEKTWNWYLSTINK